MHDIISLPHDRSEFFETEKYWNAVKNFFEYELKNDGEDLSSQFFLQDNKNSEIYVIVKESGVFAGKQELDFLLKHFFSKEKYEIEGTWSPYFSEERALEDGNWVEKNQKIFRARGNAYALMKFERVFLNVLSRMSGIATQARRLTGILEKFPVKIAATRKTQWSYLDKKAVHIGGGLTHRMGLFDAIMLKENHQIIGEYQLDISGYLDSLDDVKTKNQKKQTSHFLEIEVETPEEFQKIFDIFWETKTRAGQEMPKVIMLDNFSPEKIRDILADLPQKQNKQARHTQKIFLEASGGISERTLAEYAKTGVDVVSMGGLTNFVKPLDYSMRVKKEA